MKVNELIQEAQDELNSENKAVAKEVLKERLREIAEAEKTLAEMKSQLTGLLDKNVEDVLDA